MGMYNKKGLADNSASTSSTEIGKLCRLTRTDGKCSEGNVLNVPVQKKANVDSRKTRLGRENAFSRTAKRKDESNAHEEHQRQNKRARNVTRKRVKVVPITKRHQYSRTRTVTSVTRL